MTLRFLLAGLCLLPAAVCVADELPTPSALADPAAAAEPAKIAAPAELSFRQYLQLMEQANRNLAAQRLSVPIAEAQISVARVRPNPSVTAGIDSHELASQRPGRKPPTTYTYGLSQTLELGGKRGARVGLAEAGRDLAQASLADFQLQLRGAAAQAYIAALRTDQALAVKRKSLEALERVTEINAEKRLRGAASDLVVTQAQVELDRARNETTAAEAERDAALNDLLTYVGDAYGTQPPHLLGSLGHEPREYVQEQALATALSTRPDILAAQRALGVAERQVALARSNRWVDVDLAANLKTTAAVGAYTDDNGNPAGSTPQSRVLGVTLTVPIPLSNLERGELRAALLTRDQAALALSSAQRDARTEVLQALTAYNAARARLQRFDAGIRDNAQKVLDATLYSYERGGASQLELLEARRTNADTQLEYVQTLADFASAWVGVEQALGTWQVDF